MTWKLIVNQLQVGLDKRPKPHRFVPNGDRAKGEVCPGSATDAVAKFLDTKHPMAWWTRQQIVVATNKSQKAVDWALIFLRTTGRVEICHDSRNPRYLRYRLLRSYKNDAHR